MPPVVKEPLYYVWANETSDFDFRDWKQVLQPWNTELDAYLSLFDQGREAKAVGEASPAYLPHPSAPRKIHQDCPDARIIVSLRNPIDRAYSHYTYNRMRYMENLPTFQQALDAEVECRNPYYSIKYAGVGLYSKYIRRYFETFGEERVKIVFFEDLVNDPRSVCREIFEFLDVSDDVEVNVGSPSNPTLQRNFILAALYRLKGGENPISRSARALHAAMSRSHAYLNMKKRFYQSARRIAKLTIGKKPAQMNPADRARLREYFEEDIAGLEKITGRDLSHWRR